MKEFSNVKVLHILSKGSHGGIERLALSISKEARFENHFIFIRTGGAIYEQIKQNCKNSYVLKKQSFNKNMKELIEYVRQNKINVIVNHHSDFLPELYFIKLKKNLKYLKAVTIVHSCFYNHSKKSIKEKIFDLIRKKTLKISDAIIYVSNAGRLSYEQIAKGMSYKEYVVYNGITEEFLESGRKSIKTNDIPKILYMGRIEAEKGLFILIDALKSLKGKGFIYQCQIVGSGTKTQEIRAKIEYEKISDCVELLPATNTPEKFYEKNNIFVYPSICEEVFGISLVEAMAYGLISITNKVGGTTEVIENDVDGIIANEKSKEGLELAIRKAIGILEDKKEMTKFVNAAKNKASSFSVESTINGYHKVFYELLKTKK